MLRRRLDFRLGNSYYITTATIINILLPSFSFPPLHHVRAHLLDRLATLDQLGVEVRLGHAQDLGARGADDRVGEAARSGVGDGDVDVHVQEPPFVALLHVGLDLDLAHVLLVRVFLLHNVQVRLEARPLEQLGAQREALAQGLLAARVRARLAVGVDRDQPARVPHF